MAELKAMLFEEGTDQQMGIRCRLMSEWYKIDYFVSSKIELLLEIKKHNPVIVFLDSNLYEKIDGIETAQTIQTQYNIPVIYF